MARLPLMAARVGLDAMAISDHDTLRSVQYAYDHPVQDGVKLIPATELTGYDYERQHRVHLLAYWPDPESEALRRHCDIIKLSAVAERYALTHLDKPLKSYDFLKSVLP